VDVYVLQYREVQDLIGALSRQIQDVMQQGGSMKSKSIRSAIVTTLVLCGGLPTSAAGYAETATVVRMGVSRNHGNYLFIKLGAAPVGGPGCS
jgi:hypothetical protein